MSNNLTYIIIVVVVLILLMYNMLISKRNNVKKAQSNIGTYTQKRLDVLTSMVEAVKKYISFEGDLQEKLARIRKGLSDGKSNGDFSKVLEANNDVSALTKEIQVSVEAYPDLKSSDLFLRLMEETSTVEAEINAARRVYNDNVNSYNTSLEILPTSILGALMGCQKEVLFEAEEVAAKRPKLFE